MTYEEVVDWIYENRNPQEKYYQTLARLNHPIAQCYTSDMELLSDTQALDYAIRTYNQQAAVAANSCNAFIQKYGQITAPDRATVSIRIEDFKPYRAEMLPHAYSMQIDVEKGIVHLKFVYIEKPTNKSANVRRDALYVEQGTTIE